MESYINQPQQQPEQAKFELGSQHFIFCKELGQGADGNAHLCRYFGNDEDFKENNCTKISVKSRASWKEGDPEFEYYFVLKIPKPGVDVKNELEIGTYLGRSKENKYNSVQGVTYRNGNSSQLCLAGPVQYYSHKVTNDGVEFATSDLLGFFEDTEKSLGKAEATKKAEKQLKANSDLIFAQTMFSAYQSLKELHKKGVLQLDTAARNFLLVPTEFNEAGTPVKFAVVVTDYGRSKEPPKKIEVINNGIPTEVPNTQLKVVGLKENPPIIWSNAERLGNNGSVSTDLWGFRMMLFEAISACTGNYKDAFQSIIRNPNPQQIDYIDEKGNPRTVEADGSHPFQVGMITMYQGDDAALNTFVRQAESYLQQTNLAITHPEAYRFFKSFESYIATQKSRGVSMTGMEEAKDEEFLKMGFRNFIINTTAAKLHQLAVGLDDKDVSNRQTAIENFVLAAQMLLALEKDANLMKDTKFVPEMTGFLEKLLSIVQGKNINWESIKEMMKQSDLVKSVQGSMEKEISGKIDAIVNNYAEQTKRATSFINSPTISDLKNLERDSTLSAIEVLEKELAAAEKLYVNNPHSLPAAMDSLKKLRDTVGKDEKIWQSFEECKAKVIHDEYNQLLQDYNHINKPDTDKIDFAKSLHLLLRLYNGKLALDKAKIKPTQEVDFQEQLKLLAGYAQKNPELNPILLTFQTKILAPNHVFQQSLPPVPIMPEAKKEQTDSHYATLDFKNTPINLDQSLHVINTLKSVWIGLGTPEKIKSQLQFNRDLLNETARMSSLKFVHNNLIQVANAFDEIIKAKKEYEQEGKTLNLEDILAVAALNGEDVSQIKHYAKDLFALAEKELSGIKKDISSSGDIISKKSQDQKSNSGQSQLPPTETDIQQAQPKVEALYREHNKYIADIKSLVEVFLKPDGTLKNDNEFMKPGQKLSTAQRELLSYYLKPYYTIATSGREMPYSGTENAAAELMYTFLYEDPKFLEAQKLCAHNQADFLRFIKQDLGGSEKIVPMKSDDSEISHPLKLEDDKLSSTITSPISHSEKMVDRIKAISIPANDSELALLKPRTEKLLEAQHKKLTSSKKAHSQAIESIVKAKKEKIDALRNNLLEKIDVICKDSKDDTLRLKTAINALTKYGMNQKDDEIGILRTEKIREVLTNLLQKKSITEIREYVNEKLKDPELNIHRNKKKTEEPELVVLLRGIKLERERSKHVKNENTIPVTPPKVEVPNHQSPPEPTPEEILQRMVDVIKILQETIRIYNQSFQVNPDNSETLLPNSYQAITAPPPTTIFKEIVNPTASAETGESVDDEWETHPNWDDSTNKVTTSAQVKEDPEENIPNLDAQIEPVDANAIPTVTPIPPTEDKQLEKAKNTTHQWLGPQIIAKHDYDSVNKIKGLEPTPPPTLQEDPKLKPTKIKIGNRANIYGVMPETKKPASQHYGEIPPVIPNQAPVDPKDNSGTPKGISKPFVVSPGNDVNQKESETPQFQPYGFFPPKKPNTPTGKATQDKDEEGQLNNGPPTGKPITSSN